MLALGRDLVEARVAAGDDEGQGREGDVAVGEEGRLHVPGHVVHRHQRQAVGEGDALGGLHAHQQRAHEPRSPGHRHRLAGPRSPTPASASAASITGQMFSMWCREASSGTTPP